MAPDLSPYIKYQPEFWSAPLTENAHAGIGDEIHIEWTIEGEEGRVRAIHHTGTQTPRHFHFRYGQSVSGHVVQVKKRLAVRLTWIHHQNELTVKAWEKAVQKLHSSFAQFKLRVVQRNPVNPDTYVPKKAGRNNGVAVIRGNCGVIVNVQQKRLNEH